MRTVFTIWNDRIAPVFDVAGQALVIVSENDMPLAEENLVLSNGSVMAKVASLAEARANVLICGAISRPARFAANAYGIEVYPFIAGTVREVIQAWLEGRLGESAFAMPGCGRKHTCQRRRNRGSAP
jgi:predicted Fe-Mo cluster-binding NifX family protein